MTHFPPRPGTREAHPMLCSHGIRAALPIILALLNTVHAQEAPVVIQSAENGHEVSATTYQAAVTKEGYLSKLTIAGNEFFRGPQGAYFYQDGVLPLPEVSQPDESTISARGEKAEQVSVFGPDTITWKLTNLTDRNMVYVIVFTAAVKAARDSAGEYWKAPLEANWTDSAWFIGSAKLEIRGSTRVWGPFAKVHQIWEVAIPAKSTREVTLIAGHATEEEAKRAAREAARIIEPPSDPEGPMWDLNRLSKPPAYELAAGYDEPGLQAIFYEGEPFRGRPTRVFAWLGIPDVPEGEKVPAMVLVHGGGGTAFASWVRLWNDRGYAAISMDTCGCTSGGEHGTRPRHPDGGPAGWGGFGQIDWPREDQWTYHAVSAAILGHSLLRSLPQVDPDRIGLTGISWGGYLTSIIAGIDHRFRFAVPVYGCGYYLDTAFGSSVRSLGGERTDRWMRWWDPSNYLKFSAMPMLWVSGSNDFAYWFPALQKSYRDTQGTRDLCIRLRMPHGHGPAGEAPAEIHAFADHFLKGGPALAKITGWGRNGNSVWATFESPVPVVKAELNFTRDLGNWPDRNWEATPARIGEGGLVTAELPEGATVYYLNLFDTRDLVISTEHEVLREE